jgi:hypothetical protein
VAEKAQRVSSREPHPSEAVGSALPRELLERSRQAAELLREWMAADPSYDEKIWPLLEEELAGSRTRIGSSE